MPSSVEASSQNFSAKELRCKCKNCKQQVPHKISQEAVDLLQKLRDTCGFPLHLSSAYRCHLHSAEVRKAKPGQHNTAAFDIKVGWGRKRGIILINAVKLGFRGLGFADNFLHLDPREVATTWTYGTK